MDCGECSRLISGLASVSELDTIVDSSLRAHLDVCPACRDHVSAAKQLFEALDLPVAVGEGLSTEAVEATSKLIWQGVREIRMRRTWTGRFHLPQWICDPMVATAAACLIVMLAFLASAFSLGARSARDLAEAEQWRASTAALRLKRLFSDDTFVGPLHPRKNTVVADVPAPVSLEPNQPQVVAAASVPAPAPVTPTPEQPPLPTFAELKAQFKELKESRAGLSQAFCNELRRYIDEVAETPDQQILAHHLLVAAYEELAATDRSVAAMDRLIGLVEERDGADEAGRVGRRRAFDSFYHENELLRGIAYWDLIVARYPESDRAQEAIYTVGRYYERQGMRREAVAHYRRLAEQYPGTGWAKRAHQTLWLSMTHYNWSGVPAELRRYAELYPSAGDQAYARYNLAMALHVLGVKHYPEAIQELQYVSEHYPRSEYASKAKALMGKIGSSVLDGV